MSTTDVKERISTMGYLFVAEGLVDPSITAIDSTLLKAKGMYGINHPWRKRNSTSFWYRYRCSVGGYSHTKKGWIFGYKLHLTSTTTADVGKIVVPLTAADVTTVNVPDNKITFL